MQLLLLTCFSLYVFNVEAVHKCHDVKGYYWRDYTGDIPSDALVGGKDDQGNSLYIGQTIYPQYGVIVPGKISATTKKMYFESDRTEHPVTEDVKILCSSHPEHFEWIGTKDNENVLSVVKDNKQLITGGHYRPNPIAIGRRTTVDEIQVGKVVVNNGVFEGIHLTKDGKGWEESSFEVLVYIPPDVSMQIDSGVEMDCGSQRNCSIHKTLTINLYT